MIIIKHRVNSISKLKNTPKKYGVEIDLRSDKKSIYLQHDPFKKGVEFDEWLKNFHHKLIILNVKEEGLENKVIKILKKKRINSFFFHDQTFSSLLKNMRKTRCSVRYSEFEEIKKKNYIFKYIKWLWVDHFTKFPLDKKFYKFLKRNKIKICLVSPELVNKKFINKISKFKQLIYKNNFIIDAVCTKKPSFWEK
jgi:hypothetical protein